MYEKFDQMDKEEDLDLWKLIIEMDTSDSKLLWVTVLFD